MNFKKSILLILFFGISNLILWGEIFRLKSGTKIIFFNVGQGDAIFIESRYHHQILIDGGPNKKLILNKISKELTFFDKDIDLIILTHPELDHLNGLLAVLDNFKVENIIWNKIKRDSNIYFDFLKKIKEEEAKVYSGRAGLKIKAGEIIVLVLFPFEDLSQKEIKGKTSNDTSVVVELFVGGEKFLFLGDITKKVEREIVKKYPKDNISVLKIAHHGSKFSTSEELLEHFHPFFAVISCGKNNYGHPHTETLNLLSSYDIKILRTDKDGDIKFLVQ